MTIESWEVINPYICKGLCAINKIMKGNPDWWMIKVFDGFGAHLFSLKEMVGCYNNRNISFKEDGK